MTIVLYLYATLLILCIASIPVYIFIITVRHVDSIYEDSIGGADLGDSSSSRSNISSSPIYTSSGVRDNKTTGTWTVNASHHLQHDSSSEEQLVRQYRYKLLKLQNYQSHLTAAAHISNGSSTGRLTRIDRGRRSDSHSRAARNDSSIHTAATALNRSSSSSIHQTNRTRSKLAYLKHPPSVSFEHLRLQAFSDEYDAYVGQRHLDRTCGSNMTTFPPVLRTVAVVNINMSATPSTANMSAMSSIVNMNMSATPSTVNMNMSMSAKPSTVNMSMSAKPSTCIDYVYNQSRMDKLRNMTATRLHHSMLRRQYAHYFYNLSLQGHHISRVHAANVPRLHLIRVPKASSSSLSMVARRMVGCHPPGPCCKWPGDPHGSCPSKLLFQCERLEKVIGCTNHLPNYDSLLNSSIESITMLREPISRAISGFFYDGIHRNTDCVGDIRRCIIQYTTSNRWRSVVVKLLTGEYAYADIDTCVLSRTCENSVELAVENLSRLSFVGLSELWELSLAMLHRRFPTTVPSLGEFLLGSRDVTESSSTGDIIIIGQNNRSDPSTSSSSATSLRRNSMRHYEELKFILGDKYRDYFVKQNRLDLQIYSRAVHNACLELHRSRLWDDAQVREYWQLFSPRKTVLCP